MKEDPCLSCPLNGGTACTEMVCDDEGILYDALCGPLNEEQIAAIPESAAWKERYRQRLEKAND